MSASVCCWEAERGASCFFSHGQLFRSVNHTNPWSSLRGSTDWPTDHRALVPAIYSNNAKPPLSSLGAPLLGCSCGPQECTVVVDRTVCVWEFEVVWDCREHMSWPVVIHPQILVSVQRWFIGQHGPARGDFLVPFTYCYCGVSKASASLGRFVGSFVGWLVR